MKKSVALFVVSIENSKILKYHTYFEKKLSFLLFAMSVAMKMKKIFKEEESIDLLQIRGLIKNI